MNIRKWEYNNKVLQKSVNLFLNKFKTSNNLKFITQVLVYLILSKTFLIFIQKTIAYN